MENCKNIAITGRRGAGKSTLALNIIKELHKPCCGFQTLRYDMTEMGPLYELRDIISGKAEPISRLTDEGIRGIPESFDGFGAEAVKKALSSPCPIILLDEIGRFERNSPKFIGALFEALDSPKLTFAVLKQEELPYIEEIKKRRDTFLIDLDTVTREVAGETLKNLLKLP